MIRVLDPLVAAQIAAGEVVERPASVVKELLENALDAGARRIRLAVRGGGIGEISIQDDGAGIPAAEVETAFMRHATSKLSDAADLWAIATLGFRGEALPSIAAVAQVICTTRCATEPLGVELRVAGGEVQSRQDVGAPVGTTMVVRNLFYNLPVRREFLRSTAAEHAAITAVVTQYALAYPAVRFSLIIDERVRFETTGAGHLPGVMLAVYGLEVAQKLIPVTHDTGGDISRIALDGLVAPAELSRASREALHVSVNGRMVAPRGVIAAIFEEAYHGLLLKGRFPLAVLALRVHPSMVDVNVHPAKIEVKFRTPERVCQTAAQAIQAALLRAASPPKVLRETPISDPIAPPDARPMAAPPVAVPPSAPPPPDARPMAAPPVGGMSGGARDIAERPAPHPRSVPAARADAGAVAQNPALPFDASAATTPRWRALTQYANAYILATGSDGTLAIIDQHAAHERVTFERVRQQHAARAIERQRLLLELPLALSPAAREVVQQQRAEFAAWGFEFGGTDDAPTLRAAPASIAASQLAAAVLDAVDHLTDAGGDPGAARDERWLITLACHTSVRAGTRLSGDEQQALLEQLAACEQPHHCPHGRPTSIVITPQQLARRFGRLGAP
jgi:DNA mismatch repair protein MutL